MNNRKNSDSRDVFAYIRVSTGNQQSGILSQQNAIQQYCKLNGIEKYKIFQDENVSGAKASRPALDDMLEQIKEGKCKHLIVFSFSRFSRSCSHLLKSLEFLETYKCRFTSVSEQIETSTIMGKTLVALTGHSIPCFPSSIFNFDNRFNNNFNFFCSLGSVTKSI